MQTGSIIRRHRKEHADIWHSAGGKRRPTEEKLGVRDEERLDAMNQNVVIRPSRPIHDHHTVETIPNGPNHPKWRRLQR